MMNKKFIEKIDPKRFDEFISSATHRIYISLPNIHEEFADTLIKARSKVADIRIVIDVEESNFRNGYGNVGAIDKLRSEHTDIFVSPKNRVSFIICDNDGYFIFPESRIFAYDDIGNNAIKMDPLTQAHLIEYFFPSKADNLANKDDDVKQILNRESAIKDTVEQATKKYIHFVKETIEDIEKPKNQISVTSFDAKKFEAIKKKINLNPPVHPDLQRQIQTYSSKIQFVEMIFEGANLQVKKIKIPPDAMPFKDKEIVKALETKMRLFDKLEENDNFKDFFNLKKEVEDLRKKYCFTITSRKKNIIFIARKAAFKMELKILKEMVIDLNASIPQHLDAEILKAKKRIKEEVTTFLNNNPPDTMKTYPQELIKDKLEDIVNNIVHDITYPDPHKIVNKMSLKENFYDPTVEDFRDEDFLKELEKRKIMNEGEIEEIVSFTKAFGIKK